MHHDARGVPVTAGRADSLAQYEVALRQFQSYVGDPIATLDAALAEDPDFVTGHLMKALALYTMGEAKHVPAAREALAAATTRSDRANDRERMLMRAASELIARDWHGACRTFDRVLVDHPRDALTVQAAHLMDFYRGDALNLRNRVTRVLPHWDASLPGYSYLLGMQAFGLEEMNQYPEAEAVARRALEWEPRDGWAVHAVAHVMEMQGRIADGVRWLESRVDDWAPDNGFAFHNWWHLALYHLDGGLHARVLDLYDRRVHPQPAQMLLSLVDATALLWRLHLEGVPLGDRFERVADEWEAQIDAEAGFYVFNDFHAAMAFAACGRERALAKIRVALMRAGGDADAMGMIARTVAIPLVQGIESFAAGRHGEAIGHLEPVRDIARRFGGSHAQRDLISLTLIEAALRDGDAALARHYIAEREMLKQQESRWGPRLARRALAIEVRSGATGRQAIAA